MNSTIVYRHCGSLNLSDGGVSSKPTTLVHPSSAAGADPPVKRTTVRITNVYATSWRVDTALSAGAMGDHLRLWLLERNYRLAEEQLPRVLLHEDLDPQALRVKRWPHISTLTGATAWLFTLPSGRVVAALSLDVACEIADVTARLEGCV